MDIIIIGVGNVARALGPRWAELGHVVKYAVRDPDSDRHRALLDATPHGQIASLAAAGDADIIVIAVPWEATEEVARSLRPRPDAVVVDATNPLLPAFAGLDPASLPSGGELVARWSGSSRVVKAFSTTGAPNMVDTRYPAASPAMFLAGDDLDAKRLVADLAAAIGFDPVDIGPLGASRGLEEMALIWIRLAYVLGHGPNIAFALLRR